MTEWLRDGIEGRSLKATLRLYLIGLIALAPAAAVLALAFGDQVSFMMTPVLVLILVAVQLAASYRIEFREEVAELVRRLRRGRELEHHSAASKTDSLISACDDITGSPIDYGRNVEELARMYKRMQAMLEKELRRQMHDDYNFAPHDVLSETFLRVWELTEARTENGVRVVKKDGRPADDGFVVGVMKNVLLEMARKSKRNRHVPPIRSDDDSAENRIGSLEDKAPLRDENFEIEEHRRRRSESHRT